MYLHINQLATPMFKTFMTTILFASLFVSSQLSWAQPPNASTQDNNIDDDRRWYKVELIIFRQGGNPKEHVEQWDTNVKLIYPLEWTTLTPSRSENLAETSNEDETKNSAPISQSTLQTPLLLLPKSELTLDEAARKLQRSNQYRVLFHGAWNQGMLERNSGPAILLEGGDIFGDHRELEGSIQLKLQRYLHITTNLWITDFATNFGQKELGWPDIPTPPNKPQKRLTTLMDDRGSNLWSQLETTHSEYDNLISSPYIVENIAPIKVTRRMRSNELHYIDHPLAGILIQFTPIDALSDDKNKEVVN